MTRGGPPRATATVGRSGSGLTPQLFLFVILPLTALLIILAFGSLVLHSRAMRSLVAERGTRAVHAAADAIDDQLYHRGHAVQAVASLAGAASAQAALYQSSFFLSDFELGLAVVGPRGEVLASTGSAPDWATFPLVDLAARSRAAGEPVFSDLLTAGDPPQPTLLVAFADDRIGAVGAFHPSGLAARVLDDALPAAPQVRAWMLDSSANVLYRRPSQPAEPHPARLAGIEAALRGEEGVTFAENDGEEIVIAYSPVASAGWTVVLEEPWESADNPLLRQTQAVPLVLIPALLLSLFALGFGIRSVVQPLRTLERRAAAVAADDLSALEERVGGIAEIESLQHTLVEMGRRLRTYQDSLRRYAGAVTRSQEDERRRVARELHDDVIQALIALDQRLQIAQRSIRADPSTAADHLAELRQQTTRLLDDVRRVIRALRPIYLEDLGLPSALEMLAGDVRASSGIAVAWSLDGDPRRLHPEQEIAVYRVAQEALSNVVRHAQARTIRLSLGFEPRRVLLRVDDDGIGFKPPPDLETSDHYGLTGMKERAELIGARLSVDSSDGKGTTVTLELPL